MKRFLNKFTAFMTIVMSQVAMAFCSPVFADDVLGYDIKTGTVSGAEKDLEATGQVLQDKGNLILKIIIAIGLLVVVGSLVFHAVKLAKSGDNPNERSKATQGIIYTIIGAAVIGGAATIILTFFNILN